MDEVLTMTAKDKTAASLIRHAFRLPPPAKTDAEVEKLEGIIRRKEESVLSVLALKCGKDEGVSCRNILAW